MKKKKFFLFKSITVIGLSMLLATGCGKEKDNQTTPNVNKEADVEISSGEADIVDSPESKIDTVRNEVDISDKLDNSKRSITVYYVDDRSAQVVGKRVDVSDEYDIWNALQKNGILTENCELLNLRVNESEKKIDLDFNASTADRIRGMGTTGETEIVGCIVNTYLEAYECEGIRLTEEGEPFVSSHGASFDEYTGKISFD